MKIEPTFKPTIIDGVDYLKYIVKAIGIGWMSGILAVAAPMWLFLLVMPKRNKDLQEQILSSEFNIAFNFLSENYWEICSISAVIFILRYLFIQMTEKLLFSLEIKEGNLLVEYQKPFQKVKTEVISIEDIHKMDFETNSSEYLGNSFKLKINTTHGFVVKISSRQDPWSFKDEEKVFSFKERLIELNPKLKKQYTYLI